MICGCATLKWVNRWQDLGCAVWLVGGERQRSEKAEQWSVEHPEKDWYEDLRIERTKKRRLKKKKSRGTVTVSQREKSKEQRQREA